MNPILILILTLLLLGGVARWARIYPHTPLFFLAIVPGALSLVLIAWEGMIPFLISVDCVVIALAALDMATLPRRRVIVAEREMRHIASLRKQHHVTLTISNKTKNKWTVWVRDGVPSELEPEPAEFFIQLSPRSRATLVYQMRPSRRGAFDLEQVFIRVRSFLGLWTRYLKYPVASHLYVYPDMKQLEEYALLARTNRLSLMGVRRTRKIGQDNEFERLRDYTPDDTYKHIDWRSTARRRKLTVRDFQANQSQSIMFLVDCGRMMTNHAAGISLLDHALNAMLMMSFVALRQGDQVGLICFSDAIHSYVPPRSGMKQMNQLLHAAFDRFPNMVESRYDEAFVYLSSHCRKRALVVLITNVIDDVNSQQIHQYLANLVGKHLPLGVLLRDRGIYEAVEDPSPQGAALYQAAAAAEILSWRAQVLTDLENRGVLSLDVFPEEMTAPLVNQYLEVKARHLL